MSSVDTSTGPRSVLDVLHDQHQELQTLFTRVSQPDEDRPEVLKRIVQQLSAHVAGEKQLLTPVVKDRLQDGGQLSHELSDYHEEVSRVLLLLDRRKVNSPDVPGLVTELLDATNRHIADSEGPLFTAVRSQVPSGDLTDLGRRLASGDFEVLSHPHPHIPQSGPLGAVVGKVASAIDRARDHSTDIGRSGG